jgi:hypothetical protein
LSLYWPFPICDQSSDDKGDHAISVCGTSGDHIRHHDLLRDAIFQTASMALLVPKEERNLFDSSAARLVNITVSSWARCQGKPTAFDVTVTSPLQQSCLVQTITNPNFAMMKAAEA